MAVNTDLFQVLWFISCSLSIVGALSIICVHLASVAMRKSKLRHMLFILSIFDLLAAISYLIGIAANMNDGALGCKVMALICIFFPVAAFLATDCISLFLLLSTFYPHIRWRSRSVMSAFLTVCLVIPTCITSAVAILDIEGLDSEFSEFCWIKHTDNTTNQFLWRLLAGKAIEWTSFAFVVCCTIPTVWKMHQTQRALNLQSSTTVVRMSFVPVVFIILRIPSGVSTIMEHQGKDIATLSYLVAVGDPGQGFMNGLIYVFSSQAARRILLGPFHRCAGRRGRSTGFETEPEFDDLSSSDEDDGGDPERIGSTNYFEADSWERSRDSRSGTRY